MILHLRHITLSHFRSHRGAALELDARPVAIWGSNGVGKTNLLEAVSLLSPGRGLRRAAAEDLSRRPEAIGWKIAAEVMRGADAHRIETGAEAGRPRTVRLNGKAATQTALARIVPVVWLVPAMDRLWIEGAEGRRRFLDRICLSFQPDHGEAVLDYDKAMRDRNRLLRDQIRDSRWFEVLEVRMARAGAALTATRQRVIARLATAQQEARTAFPTAALSLTGPEGPEDFSDPDLIARALAQGRRADMAAGRTLTGPHRADLAASFAAKGVAAAQSSTGEQKALLISLILANARALAADTGTPPLVLLDEVAAHLDAGRRAALFDEIVALARRPG